MVASGSANGQHQAGPCPAPRGTGSGPGRAGRGREAEEIVLHALEPLAYEPDPLQMADTGEWHLKAKARLLV